MRSRLRFAPCLLVLGCLLAALLVSLAQVASTARAEDLARGDKRLALVIGNGNYRALPLATSANDAGLIAQTLAKAGFDVLAAANADADTTHKLFHDFATKLQAAGPDAVAFVYLSGYGLQYNGDNFFVPVDAKIARDIDVPSQAVSLADLAQALQASPAHARILIYDLARSGPFAASGLPLASGLDIVESPSGTLTALNAAPGTVSEPDLVPYGTYARTLAEMIQVTGLTSDALFKRVRLRVSERTNGSQIPYVAGNVDFTFYPTAATAKPPPPSESIDGAMPIAEAYAACILRDSMSAFAEFARAFPNDALTSRVQRMKAVRREVLIWNKSLKANTARALWTYMRRYPRGPHFGDARRKLAELKVALEPPPRFDIYDYFDLPPPSAEELPMVGARHLGALRPGLDPIPPVPASFLPARQSAFAEELPPPPILPANVLPIPVPPGQPINGEPIERTGPIVQPYVPGYDAVTTETRGTNVVVTGKGQIVSRTTASLDQGARTLLQTGTHGAVVSRTTTIQDQGATVIIQRGPFGVLLTQIVTRAEPDGSRTTTVLNGQGQLLGQTRAAKTGIAQTVARGSVPASEQIFLLLPSSGPASPQEVMTLDRLQAEAGQPRPDAGPRVNTGNASALFSARSPPPPSVLAPSSASGTPKLSKRPSMQSTPSHPADPGTLALEPATSAASEGRLKAPYDSPVLSPTGGATLGAIPPMLRQSIFAISKPSPTKAPGPGVSNTAPVAEPKPRPSAPPTPSPQPVAPLQTKAETATAGVPPAPSPSPPAAPAPAAPKLPASPPSSEPATPPTTKPVSVATAPRATPPLATGAPATPEGQSASATPANRTPAPQQAPAVSLAPNLPAVEAPASQNPAPAPAPALAPARPALTAALRLAPTDAPPSRPAPPNIGPEMLIPSRELPAVFQPPPARSQPISPPSQSVSAPAPAPPTATLETPAQGQPTQTSVVPLSVGGEPPQPPPQPGAEASAPANPTPETNASSIDPLPAQVPLPPRRPNLPTRPGVKPRIGKKAVRAGLGRRPAARFAR